MNATTLESERRLFSTRDFLEERARLCELGLSGKCEEAGTMPYCSKNGSNVYINCPRYNTWLNQQQENK
ncbi:hypothetical protein J4218_02090 [Candidatus Pacearchaeota archaeon]|nr:hypothetical protein [uncultured archaeon]AQS29144.1 hypothetical protein [uncultured archaeon]MBS3078888.1 hypothetical protein [Candidatus Pacearchaeota archaeon]